MINTVLKLCDRKENSCEKEKCDQKMSKEDYRRCITKMINEISNEDMLKKIFTFAHVYYTDAGAMLEEREVHTS